jgi:hypothetical protein
MIPMCPLWKLVQKATHPDPGHEGQQSLKEGIPIRIMPA